MYEYHVYLIKSQNRLVILSKEVKDDDYLALISQLANDKDIALLVCKTYCLGFIHGTSFNKPINLQEEFA